WLTEKVAATRSDIHGNPAAADSAWSDNGEKQGDGCALRKILARDLNCVAGIVHLLREHQGGCCQNSAGALDAAGIEAARGQDDAVAHRRGSESGARSGECSERQERVVRGLEQFGRR